MNNNASVALLLLAMASRCYSGESQLYISGSTAQAVHSAYGAFQGEVLRVHGLEPEQYRVHIQEESKLVIVTFAKLDSADLPTSGPVVDFSPPAKEGVSTHTMDLWSPPPTKMRFAIRKSNGDIVSKLTE